jgi:SpoVK/Ycf46/Vps4 family AAA+-type ATPase
LMVDCRLAALCPLHLSIAPPAPPLRAHMLMRLATEAGMEPPPPWLAREIAISLHGFVPADVRAMVDEARIMGLVREAGGAGVGGEVGGASIGMGAEVEAEKEVRTGKEEGARLETQGAGCAAAMDSISAALDATHLSDEQAGPTVSPAVDSAASASVEELASAHPQPQPPTPAHAHTHAPAPAPHSPASAPPLRLSPAEWWAAAGSVQPATLSGVATSRAALASTRWRDVGGLRRVKRRLRMIVQWPLRAPTLCAELGLGGPRGILLYGPPGTGVCGGGKEVGRFVGKRGESGTKGRALSGG